MNRHSGYTGEIHRVYQESNTEPEYFKFEFTKSLSLMLDVIVKLGEVMAIPREDMSYLEIQDLLSYHSRDSYIQTYRRHGAGFTM